MRAFECFGGERGDCTVTTGGDFGGESGPIDIGRVFIAGEGVPERSFEPGVRGPATSESETCGGESRRPLLRGISREILPPSRGAASPGVANPCCLLGEVCRVGYGDGVGVGSFELNMFSKWLRKEETGRYKAS